MLLAGLVLMLALHSLLHTVLEVVVARLDHLGYQLKEEGVRSEVWAWRYLCCSLRDILRK